MRIGLINSLSDEGAVGLRRCDAVVCRGANAPATWGLAKCFSVGSDTRERLDRSVTVITGSSAAKTAKAIIGTPAPTVVVVMKTKAKKTGPIAEAIARVERSGRRVFVVVMGTKLEAKVFNTATGKFSEPDAVSDRKIPYVPTEPKVRVRNVPRVPSTRRKRVPPAKRGAPVKRK